MIAMIIDIDIMVSRKRDVFFMFDLLLIPYEGNKITNDLNFLYL
jgi:hypothetical protein